MKYSEALALLNGRETKKIANNTYLVHRGEGVIALRLHSTDVLTFRPGSVTYDTGGWRTVTTKARFNRFGPSGVRVYSDKKVWTVYREGEFVEAYEDGFVWYTDTPEPGGEPMNPMRAVGLAEGFETGTKNEVLAAWQYLVTSGLAWTLQGWFGRTAAGMIEDGLITR